MSDEGQVTRAPQSDRRGANEAVTWPVRVAAAWSWRLLVIGIVLWLLGQIFSRVELVAFSFVIALFFTAVLHPLQQLFRKMHGPRSLAAVLALLIGLALLAGIGYFVTWQITQHASEIGDQVSNLVTKVKHWLHTGPLHLNNKDLDTITSNVGKTIKNNQSTLISGAIDTVRTVVEVISALLLILLSTFFLLRDGEQIWGWTVRLFPRASHERLDRGGRAGWRTLGGYMRGQLIIALFHGISVMVLLFILRVPLAAALGVLIFLGSFVPIIGITVSGALAVAVTLLEHGLTAGIVVTIAIVVLVQLEGNLLQPVIMSRTVEVHPLAIALSVTTGTILAGIVGALLAVPFVAFLNATIHALRASPALPVGDSGFPVRQKRSPLGDSTDMAATPGDDAAEAPERNDQPDDPSTDTDTDGRTAQGSADV